MASSSYKWIVLVKHVFISIGIVSIAMQLKFSIPFFNNITTYHLPSIMSFSKPPYLYLLINLIILTLLLSSRLQRHNSDHHHSPMIYATQVSTDNRVVVLDHDEAEFVDIIKSVLVNDTDYNQELRDFYEDDDVEIKHVLSTSPNNSQLQKCNNTTKFILPSSEKPLARSDHPKQLLKATPQGRSIDRKLRVAQKEETMESVWQRIMEGRGQMNTRSDTWQNIGGRVDVADCDRSLAFIKEASLSKDELNQRAEAFINQVTRDMRRRDRSRWSSTNRRC